MCVLRERQQCVGMSHSQHQQRLLHDRLHVIVPLSLIFTLVLPWSSGSSNTDFKAAVTDYFMPVAEVMTWPWAAGMS
jgi:hypothetical protein